MLGDVGIAAFGLWAEQVKDNEKNRQNYAEKNYQERSEIHQVKVTIAGGEN